MLKISKDLFNLIWPVGSYYETSNVTWSPQAAGWYGQWVEDSPGRVTVAIDYGDTTTFNTINKTGGSKTHTLSIEEIPQHRHKLLFNGTDPITFPTGGGNVTVREFKADSYSIISRWGSNIYTDYQGATAPHNNIQPYKVVRRWHRTA